MHTLGSVAHLCLTSHALQFICIVLKDGISSFTKAELDHIVYACIVVSLSIHSMA